MQRWYDGYVFGRTVVYNPWSVLSYLADAPHAMAPQPYWLSTSSNDLIKHLLVHHAGRIRAELEALLAGERIVRPIDENVPFQALDHDVHAVWSLLLFAGYLRAEEHTPATASGAATYTLSIPNIEVRHVYASAFRGWLTESVSHGGGDVERLTRALLAGDAATFEAQLQAFATDLLELEVARAGQATLDDALAQGLAQIAQKGHAAELRAAGAQPIHALAVAFDGKHVRVQAAPAPG